MFPAKFVEERLIDHWLITYWSMINLRRNFNLWLITYCLLINTELIGRNSATSKMSSASFLISSEKATWILSLKRKTHLRRLGTEMIKRLRLDSSAVKKDLIIITWYHECTTALMSNNCKQIHVFISFKNKIERIYIPWRMRPGMVDLPWETAPLHGFPHPG